MDISNIDVSKIKPFQSRVLIKQDEAAAKTKSGIYIPDTAKEAPKRGTVIAVGEGTEEEPMKFKVGDVVIFGRYSGASILVEDEYVILRQGEIIGIIEKENVD